MKQPSTPRRVGRPSKFDASDCEKVIAVMAGGVSVTGFAASISVNRDSVHEWAKVHPEFSVALKVAQAACQAFWEARMIAIVKGEPGNARLCICALQNMGRHDWRMKAGRKPSGKEGALVNHALTIEFIDAPKA